MSIEKIADTTKAERNNLIDFVLEEFKRADFTDMSEDAIADEIVNAYPLPCSYSIVWEVAEHIDEIFDGERDQILF